MSERWLAVALLCSSAGWTQTLEIKARIFDYANVPKSALVSAEKEAAFALGTAAVTVLWMDCGSPGVCNGLPGANEFSILIHQEAPSRSHGGEPLGNALLSDTLGCYATAYYGEIRALVARKRTISTGELLGYVIAHEIGHLLLGPQHQDGTVMQARWGYSELQMMARGQLHFSKQQRAARNKERMNSSRTQRGQTLSASLLQPSSK